MLVDLDWWVYVIIAGSVFIIFLVLNYILKKVNEAKLEGRFIRMRQKAQITQYTQVQGPLLEMETVVRPAALPSVPESTLPTPPGISLVFNQEENLNTDKRIKDLEETYNIIKNSLSATRQEYQSLKKVQSLDTHGSSSLEQELSGIRKKESSKIKETNSICLGLSFKDSKPIVSIDKPLGDKIVTDLEDTYIIIKNSLSATKQEVQSLNKVQSHDAQGSSSFGSDLSGIRKKESSKIKETNSICLGLSFKDSKPIVSIDKPLGDKRMTDLEDTYIILKNSLSATKQEMQSLNKVQSHDAQGSSSFGSDLSGIRKKESSRIKATNSIFPGLSTKDSKPSNSIDKAPDDSVNTIS